ncbi:hypothetical protein V8F20_005153 [Naviculisporaceae sp. PSN 640]
MACSQTPKGTTILIQDPVDVFREWAKQQATVISRVPTQMQGNMLSIELRRLRGDAGKDLNLDGIRQQLDRIAGMRALEPRVVERTFKYWTVDPKTRKKVEVQDKMYVVHIDRDKWSEEDTARGYKKWQCLIRESVNDKEDKRLLGGQRAGNKRSRRTKQMARAKPLAPCQPAFHQQPTAQEQSTLQTQSIPQTEPMTRRKPTAPTKQVPQTKPATTIRITTEPEIERARKVKTEEGVDPNILDEAMMDTENRIKSESDW